MMHKDVFIYLKEHEEKAKRIADLFLEKTRDNNHEHILCISGISGCGKSEIAWSVSRILYKLGISSHVINLDRFYKVNAAVRNAWRKKTGIIGHEEMDWDRIDEEVERFNNNEIRVLIFEGLYANRISGINFGIEGSIESSEEFRKIRGKEDEDDPWRQFVVGEEFSAIQQGLYLCQYMI